MDEQEEKSKISPSVEMESSSSSTPSISPLHLDLNERCRLFLQDLETRNATSQTTTTIVPVPSVIQGYASSSSHSSTPVHLLDALATLAAHDGITELVASRFAPLASDVFARWLDVSSPLSDDEWERRLAALASIAEPRRDLWGLVVAFIKSSPFRSSPLTLLPSSSLSLVPAPRLHSLLLAYWRLLVADSSIHDRLEWPTSPLHALRTEHPDRGVRLLAIKILAKLRKWSERRREEVEKEWVGDVASVDAQVGYGAIARQSGGTINVDRVAVDGWLLALHEARRVESYPTFTPLTSEPLSTPSVTEADLCQRSALVGATLLRRSSSGATPTDFVHVSTAAMSSAITSLAPCLQHQLPILISAPPSAGKTHIIHHLSTQLFPNAQPTNRILTISLADTTIDVKSLIGTYISSPTKPGTFEWMEGALAKAVRAGRWVVFEDIDKASLEMLVTITGLTRSLKPGRVGRRAKLAVPGRDEVEAGDNFALFATRTVAEEQTSSPTFFGQQHFTEIYLASPTDEDVLSILSVRFSRLPRSLTTALVEIWKDLRPFSKRSSQVKARDIGLRDLQKWCARVERRLPPQASLEALEQSPAGVLANPVVQDEVFLEAVDTFVACLDTKPSSLVKRQEMANIIAERIGLESERATALLDSRRPRLEVVRASSQIHMGRYSLDAAPKRRGQAAAQPFALTRPSLVLLERIAAAVTMAEPTLLVGETGTGKTTAVQHLATLVGKSMTALNLSTQTETSDLVGGFKPVDASAAARSLHSRWQKLFTETFSVGKAQNGAYLEAAAKALSAQKWGRCADLWSSSAKRAVDKLAKTETEDAPPSSGQPGSPRKRRKISHKVAKAAVQWQSLLVDIADFDLHHVKMKSKLVFSFVEGPLVKALKNGEWILLDEVNLATQETLEAVSTILEASSASLVLTERGDVEPIPRHPDFRLFACMNPATDVGKKDLPPGLRARFTELYVPPPDDDREALVAIVEQYLGDAAAGDKAAILDVVEMYTTLKRLSSTKEIVDGSNVAPHYSMRTLARALMFAVQSAPLFGLRRGLWEGCLMAFTMSLDVASSRRAHQVCEQYILAPMKNARAVLAQIPTLPPGTDSDNFVRFGPFWLQRGPLPPVAESRYIITPSVQAKLSDLARVILTKRYPVLIQGPTSAGKTSAVEFLARQTGHRFVRINNHEHTDIQEYLGTYITDPQTGNLVFQEGLLVTAVRQGHWIVLDELNLAPTDVLEALNRLLDDNRELVIPETQEVIKPHPNFILFATQNPPGLYAGRKVLSRAFRNRFLEVHFDDVPKDELETILCQRCQIAPSYAKRIVQVFEELRHRRQASRVFESKQSFATLRDLFRWAERGAVGYQQLAEDGYMLLAERGRNEEDKAVIKTVIEEIMKVSIDAERMYRLFDENPEGAFSRLPFKSMPPSTLVWTKAMQRLFVLVAAAAAHDEPVLLVGETGCGKTSICEVIAAAFEQALVGVNCHQNMETADLLGSQRPVRNRAERRARVIAKLSQVATVDPSATDDELVAMCVQLGKDQPDVANKRLASECQGELKRLSALFEWSDGPLIHAMLNGDLMLLDEVSLADDSVLERLNSVLEPGRTLVLAEKGGVDIDEATIVAHPKFHVVATMNPGGDFGKKELSPALRNRFTEIWVPPLDDRADLLQIIELSWKHDELRECGPLVLDFLAWFGQRVGDSSGLGLRDILAWVNFGNQMIGQSVLDVATAFHHGGQLVIVDGLESLPQVAGNSLSSIATLRRDCLSRLDELAASLGSSSMTIEPTLQVTVSPTSLAIGGFAVERGTDVTDSSAFRFEAPTTALNAMRVLRGCQLPKAILLEGSPGVGKTSLVSALSAVAGFNLQRINLSDQTDLIDLFGSDLPVEGGQAGEFQWRDAAFLDAVQKGDWVLLDEMNLASQTVLEGLNAVLDHRGTVFIPELGKSFDRHPNFRVFAAQNPLQQGGGRKGLPKSFLNRFTKVYLQEHTSEDLLIICRSLYTADDEVVRQMIAFNEVIREQTMVTRMIGREGSPWEFNLRDLFRWFQLLIKKNGLERSPHPVEFLRMVYLQRFRNDKDREAVQEIFDSVFGVQQPFPRPTPSITPSWYQVGHSLIRRSDSASIETTTDHAHLDIAESVLKAVEMGWLVILAGDSAVGKREIVQSVAAAAGQTVGEFAMHPGVDTSEILGSFEQQDGQRLLRAAHTALLTLIEQVCEVQPAFANCSAQITAARDQCDDPKQLDALSNFVALGRNLVEQIVPLAMDTTYASAALDILERTGTSSTGFAWVDGQLLDAIRTGGWYLISDANLCSASVLDRLNSLCEHNGVLVMSEKGSATGSPEVIKPHPEFRLFMTYDPKHGELSRAMRNRGVELHVGSGSSKLVVEANSKIKATSTYALSDETLLRSYEALRNGVETRGEPSTMANLVAMQSKESRQLLRRAAEANLAIEFIDQPDVQATLIQQAETISASQNLSMDFGSSLPFDAFTNPNIIAVTRDHMFHALQILLRNNEAQEQVKAWLSDAANQKSIISLSAAASRKSVRRKEAVHDHVYPFVTALRQHIAAALPGGFALAAQGNDQVLDVLAQVIIDVRLMEIQSQSEVFDYSSIKLLAAWIQDHISRVDQLSAVSELARVLAAATQVNRGLGQSQVWTVFRTGSLSPSIRATVRANLERLNDVNDAGLRSNVIEALVAAVCLPDAEAALKSVQMLIDSLPASKADEEAMSLWDDNAVAGAIETRALGTFAAQNTVDRVTLSLLAKHKSSSPTAMFEHSLVGDQMVKPAIVLSTVTGWLRRLWSSDAAGDTLGGPATLFSPVNLIKTRSFTDERSVPMSAIPEMDQALGSAVATALWSTTNRQNRIKDATEVAYMCLRQVLAAFGASLDSDGVLQFTEPVQESEEQASAMTYLQETFDKHVAPFLVTYTKPSVSQLGSLWIGLSRFILDLFVTNIPIDPGVRRVLVGERLSLQLALAEKELTAIKASELVVHGVAKSRRVQRTQATIESIQAQEKTLGPQIEREVNASRLSFLFNETYSFLQDVMGEKQSADLVLALNQRAVTALPREQGFQLAATAFVQRLSGNYDDLFDLTQPIVMAVWAAKFGFRCLARSVEFDKTASQSTIRTALTFPLVRGLSTYQQLSQLGSEPSNETIKLDILVAAAHAHDTVESEQRLRHVPRLAASLDRIYQAWSAVRLREQQESQAAESLYRVRKTEVEVLSDEELEAKEFAELFPTYEGDDAVEQKDEEIREKEDGSAKFHVEQVSAFHQLVTGTFDARPSFNHRRTLQTAVSAAARSFDPTAHLEDLDHESLAYQIALLSHRLKEQKVSPTHVSFYTAPNEFEVRKAHDLLSRLAARLMLLINEWPEQMVLQHIHDRCGRILALHTRSPVAQVLSALEQLLLHTDDWEAFANRDNSIKSFQMEISALIVSWRRLELASWTRLLDDQAEHYIAADEEWTLRLYGAAIHGAISAEDVDKYIETVLPMISTYIHSSSLGSFITRLAVLKSLQRMAAELSTFDIPGAAALNKVAKVLHNTIANAGLYASRVTDSMNSQRALLDKAIKDFIKLASWKDINVFALKASAQKSHKHLHRNIRKFRDILRQPVAPILGNPIALLPQEAATTASVQAAEVFTVSIVSPEAIDARARASASSPSPVLERLSETFSRYSAVHVKARTSDVGADASAIEAMSVDIIETAAALAKATPSTLTKDNAKIINNLASRKRKAYADLLKALRASGFSPNVRADQMASQLSSTWMAARPALVVDGLPESFDRSGVLQIDNYHHKQAVLMPNLRTALNGHNPDIATQDLQRGIGFAESIYAMALKERDILVATLAQLSRLAPLIARLQRCAQSEAVFGGVQLRDELIQAELDCCRLHEALQELETSVRRQRELHGVPVSQHDLADVLDLRQEASLLVRALEDTLSPARSAGITTFAQDEVKLLDKVSSWRQRLTQVCLDRCEGSPEFRHLFQPVVDMVSAPLRTPTASNSSLSASAWEESDSVIQALLVVAQTVGSLEDETKDDGNEYPHVPSMFTRQAQSIATLHVQEVVDRLIGFTNSLADQVSDQGSTMAPACVSRLLPFVEVLAESLGQALLRKVHTVKSVYKLNYVLARLLLDLAQKGFCKPSEESDDKQDGNDSGEIEGTGMGAGTGEQNVSSEIKDESQVEGLQGEEDEEQEKKNNDEDDDDAVSMDEDFEGALEDGKEGEEDDKDEDADEDDEPDDHVGDVDPLDPGAVDEKFWGDEENNKQGEDSNELMNEKTEEKEGETEMSAKEGESKEKKSKEEKDRTAETKDTQHEDTQTAEGQEQDEEIGDEHGDDDDDNDNEGRDEPVNQDQVEMPEGDRLDLPDDLDLGDEDDQGDEGNDAFDDDIKMDEADEDDHDHDGPPEDNGITSDNEGADDEDAPAAAGVTEDDVDEPQEETANQNLDISASNDATAQETAAAGKGQGAAQEQESKQDEVEGDEEEREAGEAEDEATGATSSAPQGGGSADQQDTDGPTDSTGAPMPADGQQQQQPRSLGDIMKEIQRRRDEILEQQTREETTERPDAPTEAPAEQVEYLQEGDADENMQALGPARDEQQTLEDLHIVDEEEKDDQAPPRGMEEDEDVEDVPLSRPAEETIRPEREGGDEKQNIEKALTQADIIGGAPTSAPNDAMDVDGLDGDEATGEMKPDVEEEEADLIVTDVPNTAELDQQGEDLWRQYASLTSDLSYALCEQLRLILEPTLAIRLQGDFRTGKRLNMRKIIPYIASEYTKDKIWLRRTKPSRREYQVLLSLDDSRSMAESHSVSLAYQTLALVAQALNKLEVGQVSIAKFGEHVDVLHQFAERFSDADGAKVMRAFKFDQQKTDVAALVERTLTYLAESRQKQLASSSSPDLWQLQIIISDGVCQDHHRLRTLLRRALEERVMIVFLIVDSLHQNTSSATQTQAAQPQQRTSILSMQTVNYTNVNGEMKIEMQRYLDTFPFEFYVVLRDVEALPGVLADTLRQWMARVSQSQE